MSVEKLPGPQQPDELALIIDHAVETESEERLSMVVTSDDQVKDYLKSIGKRPLLNAAEEVGLAQTIEAGLLAEKLLEIRAPQSETAEVADSISKALGDIAARLAGVTNEELEFIATEGQEAIKIFVESNLRLVVSIAKKYQRGELSMMELVQEGNLGLMHAVELFDYTKGFKFSTYSSWWIRQAITRAISNQSRTIRLPVHVAEKVAAYEKTRRTLEATLGREASVDEIAAAMETPREKILEYIKYGRNPISLDTPLGDGGGVGRGQSETTFQEIIEDQSHHTEDEVLNGLLRAQIIKVLDTLKPREAGIIKMRYGIDTDTEMTLDEVGECYGVTRERIRQLQKSVLARLRQNPDLQALKDNL